jgi:hypothetical protein
MTEEARKRPPQDASRINIEEKWEVRWWCEKLGCNEMRLKNAVRAVGPSTEAVRKYMDKQF